MNASKFIVLSGSSQTNFEEFIHDKLGASRRIFERQKLGQQKEVAHCSLVALVSRRFSSWARKRSASYTSFQFQ